MFPRTGSCSKVNSVPGLTRAKNRPKATGRKTSACTFTHWSDVHTFEFKHKGKKYEYLDIEDEKGLLELVQMGAVELHPWGSAIDAIDCPDRMIFDLDPGEDVPFREVKGAALDLRQRLKSRALESVLKCTGGKGLHLIVPLAAMDEWPRVKSFAASIAKEMTGAAPYAYIDTMSKAKRGGKIFVDYLRNDYTATAIADYSVRARPGAPVAVPIHWNELNTVSSADEFTIKDVLQRLNRAEALASSKKLKQRIPLPRRTKGKSTWILTCLSNQRRRQCKKAKSDRPIHPKSSAEFYPPVRSRVILFAIPRERILAKWMS